MTTPPTRDRADDVSRLAGRGYFRLRDPLSSPFYRHVGRSLKASPGHGSRPPLERHGERRRPARNAPDAGGPAAPSSRWPTSGQAPPAPPSPSSPQTVAVSGFSCAGRATPRSRPNVLPPFLVERTAYGGGVNHLPARTWMLGVRLRTQYRTAEDRNGQPFSRMAHFMRSAATASPSPASWPSFLVCANHRRPGALATPVPALRRPGQPTHRDRRNPRTGTTSCTS